LCKLECRGLLGLLLATAGGGVVTPAAIEICDDPRLAPLTLTLLFAFDFAFRLAERALLLLTYP
jgi:hypothetical protein